MKRLIRDIVLGILLIIIVVIVVLYAREGRLSFKTLRDDFVEAVNLKGERIEERLNYNPIEPEALIEKLKANGLVVGDVEELGGNSLGAKRGVKFNVEGYYMYFYIIDWDNEPNDDYIKQTRESIEKDGKVYIEGKYYDAYVNGTAIISKIDNNPKKDLIVKLFKSMESLSYDEMVERRTDNSLNPAVTTVDKVLDGFEFAIK